MSEAVMPAKRQTLARARRIGLVYDLRDAYLAEGFSPDDVAEFDSPSTIDALDRALRSLGFQVVRIGHGRRLAERLARGDRWDLVFTIAEGLRGRSREAQAPALLELYGVPYTFSDPLTCALTLDKALTKQLVRAAGIPTPPFHVVCSKADIGGVRLNGPLFVKPVAEGTGKGVDARSCVRTRRELGAVCRRLLRRHAQPVLVEEYLPGREFTIAVLGADDDARVLGAMEISVRPGAPARDYSHEVKERCEQYARYFPMPPGALRRRVEALALKTYRAFQCRDAGRLDFRLDRRGCPAFLEINPIPGLHPTHSDLPMIATQAGMSYRALIAAIVRGALRRAREKT
ncbi:MAG: D-alanine--D-alanine ligase [Verrucomicrobiota bacterium]|nr:D-alanine--D-alanine ligase [Verrucomicrobiota bacterium]